MRKKPLIILSLFAIFLLVLGWKIEKQASSTLPLATTMKQSLEEKKWESVETYLAAMTVEEKVGQLFFARVPAVAQQEDLATYQFGGYLLFGRDMSGQTMESLAEIIASYQALSSLPLLIGSDEEGGSVTRLSQLLEFPFASPQELYQTGGLELVLSETRRKAQILKSLGIQVGFFPVADIAQRPEAFIYDRTLGQDLETTKTYVAETVHLLREEQIASTLKHFPGYGNNGDSHTNIIVDPRALSGLKAYDLQVFEAGINSGADSVLVTHNIIADVDDVPASISPEVIKILREEMGFSGVILTDDFDMAGLADFISQEEAAFRAIQAGNDMVLSSQYAIQIPYILDKIAQGELTEERLDQSVRRILGWKYDLGLLD